MIMVLKHGKMVEPCREANAAKGRIKCGTADDFPQIKRMPMLARLCEVLQMTGLGNLQYIHWDDAAGGVMVKYKHDPRIHYMLAGKIMKDVDLVDAVIQRVREEYR